MLYPESQITGVILSGGKSTRMGSDKALLKLKGKTLIEYVSETMRLVFERVNLITNKPDPYRFLHLETFTDIYHDCGPLGGIHSALVHSSSEGIFVAACDTPFISTELIRYIIDYPAKTDAKIPFSGTHAHPLCGWYSRQSLPAINSFLKKKHYKILDLIKEIPAASILIDASLPFYTQNIFLNVNRRADLNKIQ